MNRWRAHIPVCVLLLAALGLASDVRAAELKSDERVVLHPAMGWQANNRWEIEASGWVFEPERRRLVESVVRRALGFEDDEMTAEELRIFRERIQPFLMDSEGGKRVAIRLGEDLESTAESNRGGRCQWRFTATDEQVAHWRSRGVFTNGLVQFSVVRGSRLEVLPTPLALIEATGTSIISDIDDTIKVSAINNRRELLRNTFCRPMKPVPGMAEVYRAWAGRGAQFHYVSASPWQLYGPLSDFVRGNGFPAGTFHLKQIAITDGTLRRLFESPEEYKLPVIEDLLARFPQRQFILIGDSGEQDPEIYAELARKHPAQVAKIIIRETDGVPMDEARLGKAFTGLPRERWQAFKSAKELQHAQP